MPSLWEMESWERPEQCLTTAAPDTVLRSCRSGSQAGTRSAHDARKKLSGHEEESALGEELVETRGRFFLLHFRCQRRNYLSAHRNKTLARKKGSTGSSCWKQRFMIRRGKKRVDWQERIKGKWTSWCMRYKDYCKEEKKQYIGFRVKHP